MKSAGREVGRRGYVHIGEMDMPVMLVRNGAAVYPFADWRGLFTTAVEPNGDQLGCYPDQTVGCLDIRWPSQEAAAWRQTRDSREYGVWYGTLLADQRDASGLLYRRNRYYDPQAGQFTQQDPIGIAGGLNLYGYTNGDPINFSDPFGLCPDEDRDEEGKCPAGLSEEQWDAAMTAAARVVGMSESRDSRPEYAMFVLGDGAGRGTVLPVVYGGGSSSRVVGTPWYPGGLPYENPAMAVAMVHSHPDRPNGEGGLTYVSLEASARDIENAKRRKLPMFIASHRGVRLYLPSGLAYPKQFLPPGN